IIATCSSLTATSHSLCTYTCITIALDYTKIPSILLYMQDALKQLRWTPISISFDLLVCFIACFLPRCCRFRTTFVDRGRGR
ncbi:hypothetical protein C8R44DRAFT_805434, partial [Mycena epipterygia]